MLTCLRSLRVSQLVSAMLPFRKFKTFANTIHKVTVTVRYDGLTQFRLGGLEYVKSIVIRLYVFHRLYLHISRVVPRPGRRRFQT